MPKDETTAMYKAEGAGVFNVSEIKTEFHNEVAINGPERSYTPVS
jgi:hypothetical protein